MQDKFINWLLGLYSVFISIFYPIQILLFLIIITFILNILSGYNRGLKEKKIKGIINKWKFLSAEKIDKSITKMIISVGFTMFLYYFALVLINNASFALYLVRLTTFIILFAQLKKICENFDIIVGGSIFTSIFDKITKIFEKKIEESKPE